MKTLKLLASTLIVALVVALNPVGASAEWRQVKDGYWKYTEGNSYATGWREIDGNWYYFYPDGYMAHKGWQEIDYKEYYFEPNGHMKTGWIEDTNGLWYYLKTSGEKAFNTVIDGCTLDYTGAWAKPSEEAEEARNLILKEDSKYIYDKLSKDEHLKLATYCISLNVNVTPTTWNIPQEPYYEFSVNYCGNNGEILFFEWIYLVGKNSRNVYAMPNQVCMSAYQIENNQIVKTFKFLGEGGSHEWRL